jgi:hypothetical protein
MKPPGAGGPILRRDLESKPVRVDAHDPEA